MVSDTPAAPDTPVAPDTTDPPTAEGSSPDTEPADRLSARGRRTRLLVSLVVGGLLILGTFWGSDDSFPFGPFRMYSYANKPDGVVFSTRAEAIDVTGRRVKLSNGSSGLRRAELEGQLTRFEESPALLAELATAYQRRNPDAPEVVQVEIWRRRYNLEDGRPTPGHQDELIAGWDLTRDEPLGPDDVSAPTAADRAGGTGRDPVATASPGAEDDAPAGSSTAPERDADRTSADAGSGQG